MAVIVLRTCNKCGCDLPLEKFPKNKRLPSGRTSTCSKCKSDYDKKWRKENSNDYHKRYYLRTSYGITLEEHEQLLQNQSGACAICGRTGKLHIDHDHDTGAIRGLLCGSCNRGIGLMQDSSSVLRLAAAYLDRTGGK